MAITTVLTGTLSPEQDAVRTAFLSSIDEVWAADMLDFVGLPVYQMGEYGPALVWDWEDYAEGYTYKVSLLETDLYVMEALSQDDADKCAFSLDELTRWLNGEAITLTLGERDGFFLKRWASYDV